MNVASPPSSFINELEQVVEEISPADAPALIGDLERLKAKLWMRMYEATKTAPRATTKPDRLLGAAEVAEILAVNPRWVREHADEVGCRVRMPGNSMRFSERKLLRWIKQRTP